MAKISPTFAHKKCEILDQKMKDIQTSTYRYFTVKKNSSFLSAVKVLLECCTLPKQYVLLKVLTENSMFYFSISG